LIQPRLGQIREWRLAEKGRPQTGDAMEGGYAAWMGQPVVLRVLAGNIRVPLRGRLMMETADMVRLRIAESWDVDIFKSMILAIEHDNPVYVVN
jgi:hypothetical protein